MADLDPDMCVNEHSQRNPSTMVGAAMVDGIVFPPCFMEEGVCVNTGCHVRMLDDVCFPHCIALWHRNVEQVVAGRQRPVTHQPAHQGVF